MRAAGLISNKALVVGTMGLLTAMLVLGAGWQISKIHFPDHRRLEALITANRLSDHLLEAAAAQAKERGFTAAYIGAVAQGRLDRGLRGRVNGFRAAGDRSVRAALRYAERLVAVHGSESVLDALDNYKAARTSVAETRAQIDAAAPGAAPLTAETWIKRATRLIMAGNRLRIAAFAPRNGKENGAFTNLTTKQALWMMAEYAGRERAVLGHAASSGLRLEEATVDQLSEWRSVVDQQLLLLEGAYLLYGQDRSDPGSNTPIRQAWYRVKTVFLGDYQNVRQAMWQGAERGDYPLSADEWLTRSTEAIDTLLELNAAIGRAVEFRLDVDARETQLALQLTAAAAVLGLLLPVVVLVLVYRDRRER